MPTAGHERMFPVLWILFRFSRANIYLKQMSLGPCQNWQIFAPVLLSSYSQRVPPHGRWGLFGGAQWAIFFGPGLRVSMLWFFCYGEQPGGIALVSCRTFQDASPQPSRVVTVNLAVGTEQG